MNDMYRTLLFDDPDGGVWKQGWEIRNPETWSAEDPLEVFVVMHSHTDPGWVKTFDQYFHDQVKGILDSSLKVCEEDKRNRFIYAEMSFFSRWWASATTEQRKSMKHLLSPSSSSSSPQQFEIVAGGWVMNDEATVHYAAAINQYMTGHEWLRKNVGILPRSGWAIDPFGHSPTMAYLYRKMGLNHTLIQRTHYAIKKEFSLHKQLEFYWRQQWETSTDNTDFLTHMMPLYALCLFVPPAVLCLLLYLLLHLNPSFA